jgi:M6 family metalloprotease-like protein
MTSLSGDPRLRVLPAADAVRERLAVPDLRSVDIVKRLEPTIGQRLVPDVEGPWPQVLDDAHLERVRSKLADLRGERWGDAIVRARRPAPDWNSVALFFNLPAARRPGDYVATTSADARNWLDEGANPASPTISHFVQDYWRTVTRGHLNFGVDTPRDASGAPLVPEVDVDPQDWVELAKQCINANAEAVWRAAGSLEREGRRLIPSVVVVQHYWTHASAWFGGWVQTVGGVDYEIGDVTHITYSLDFLQLNGTTTTARGFWGTLTHEFSHNFTEFWDLYGPQGCTGYWDLLGDNTPPFVMSEICSAIKHRVGWLDFKQVIEGPSFPATDLALRPYTTTGEAFKVVPDPVHTPHEYFLLEYRKSTGTEAWRPDGGLHQEGLLILHINDRIGVPGTWLSREAPWFDPEFADFSDNGAALWTGWDRLDGVLFPQGARNAFTPTTSPNSGLYGGRRSGLSITDIRVEGGEVRFRLAIDGSPTVGWTVSDRDRALAGKFSRESVEGGDELFLRNDDAVALVAEREAQFIVRSRQDDWIGGWNLGTDNYEVVGDLDGDGFDEIYIRSPDWAGVLKWNGGAFDAVTVQEGWIGEWNLGGDNRELAADLDGDGADEIYVRSPEWAGVLELTGGQLTMKSIQHDWIDGWNLGADNQEWVGRFTRPDRDEILVRSPDWIGVFQWNDAAGNLRLASIQHDWVDGWNLGTDNWHTVADLDGDGLDEVYIRSPRWAGVLKWRDGGFRVIWMTEDHVDFLDASVAENRVTLLDGDQSYGGRFMHDRDGILHRGAGGRLAVLTWEGNDGLRVRHFLDSWLNGRWNMGAADRFVVGSYHRLGPDIGLPTHDFVSDGTSAVFIHNGWGTCAVGVNHLVFANDVVSQMGLTWIQAGELLFG